VSVSKQFHQTALLPQECLGLLEEHTYQTAFSSIKAMFENAQCVLVVSFGTGPEVFQSTIHPEIKN